MVANTVLDRQTSTSSRTRSKPVRWYQAYGLWLRSAIRLPLEPRGRRPAADADLVVQCMVGHVPPPPDGVLVATRTCDVHGVLMTVHRSPSGTQIWYKSIGTFVIAPDFKHVDVYPEDGADEQTLGLVLVPSILLFLHHVHGCPSLHAGAVVTTQGAVAFLGPSGQGKSTLTAAFLQRGAELLTDDALLLRPSDDGICGLPGPRSMKVWPETARQALHIGHDLPDLMPNYEKKFLALDSRYLSASQPGRVRALYLLARYDPAVACHTDITIQALSARDSVAALLANTPNRDYLFPAEQVPFLALYARLVAQAPVRILTYPSGFEYQEAVHARILADLEAL